MGFASNGTKNPDAFIVMNFSGKQQKIEIQVTGSELKNFQAFRSSSSEKYIEAGIFSINNGKMAYNAPSGSITTYYSRYYNKTITPFPITSSIIR